MLRHDVESEQDLLNASTRLAFAFKKHSRQTRVITPKQMRVITPIQCGEETAVQSI